MLITCSPLPLEIATARLYIRYVTHQQPDSRQTVGKQKVGDVLRSGGVNLAAMMDAAAAVAVAEDGLIREKSGRSEAFDQLSDHLRESIFS